MNDLQEMLKQQKKCFVKPDKYSFQCSMVVLQNFSRKNKFIKNLIYPWSNYDWSYVDFVDNQYNPIKLGASSKGSVTNLMRDIDILVKTIEALVSSANPDSKSAAKDPNKKNDLVPCKVSNKEISKIAKIRNDIDILRNEINKNPDNLTKTVLTAKIIELVAKTEKFMASCAVLNSISAKTRYQKPPYKDKFFKKLDGEKSSSYYAMIGSCPTKIDNKIDCENKGYTWISNPLAKKNPNQRGVDTKLGSCFKGRYALIDNSPGISIGESKSLKGLIPSIINNISQFSPDKLAFAAAGFGIPGLELQQCEGFQGFRQNHFFKIIVILSTILLIFLFLNL